MRVLVTALATAVPPAGWTAGTAPPQDMTVSWPGLAAVAVFMVAYVLVMMEEKLQLRKSIPVLLGASIIWVLIGTAYAGPGPAAAGIVDGTVRHSLVEYAELLLFLLAAMTYVNAMDERGVFNALRGWLVSRHYSLTTLFWFTGLIAFFLSAVNNNMTTALVLASVAISVGRDYPGFAAVACVNIVVASNSGGAWSPFGDITTLMVWQKGAVAAYDFLALFLPALASWLIPALAMSVTVPAATPEPLKERPEIGYGGIVITMLFAATVVFTLVLHSWLHLPPSLGMMGGLGALMLVSYILNRTGKGREAGPAENGPDYGGGTEDAGKSRRPRRLNTFNQIARSEWDTLLFFYGIIMCVGGLGTFGYLAEGSHVLYGMLGPTAANIMVGLISSVIDNIPVMFAVLTMHPDMSPGQWLLVTLTAGIGGSLLSIGSAAGVAVMGTAHGVYTFVSHLRWTWAIGLGYAAAVGLHFLVNARYFAGT